MNHVKQDDESIAIKNFLKSEQSKNFWRRRGRYGDKKINWSIAEKPRISIVTKNFILPLHSYPPFFEI